MPALALVVIVGRGLALVVVMAVWLVVFALPRLLDAIGRQTGADSYLKVGKSLLLVISALAALALD